MGRIPLGLKQESQAFPSQSKVYTSCKRKSLEREAPTCLVSCARCNWGENYLIWRIGHKYWVTNYFTYYNVNCSAIMYTWPTTVINYILYNMEDLGLSRMPHLLEFFWSSAFGKGSIGETEIALPILWYIEICLGMHGMIE